MGLFDRAKKMMQGPAAMGPSRAQSYRVACPEGHVLHGHRTEGYQALRCPECNEGIFVLPRSPLPEPATPKSGAPARRRVEPVMGDELMLAEPPSPTEVARARADHAATRPKPAPPAPSPADAEPEAEVEWVDEAEDEVGEGPDVAERQAAPAAPAPTRPRPKKAGPAAPRKPRPKAPEPEPVPAGMIRVEEPAGFAEWARRNKNPLIFAAVVLVVGMTVAWRVRQRRIEDLPKVVEIGRVEGLAKLDDGDVSGAKQLLARAAAAVKDLGGEIEGAEEIVRGAREAALLADCKGESLGAIVEEATKYNPPDAWPAHFDALYKGRSTIIMGEVLALPDPDKPGSAYVVDQPIHFGNGPIPAGGGRLDLSGFRLLEQARPNLKDVVTFGARLKAVRFDPGKSEWVVELEPDSGAFITHARALAHWGGWDEDARAADEKEVGP